MSDTTTGSDTDESGSDDSNRTDSKHRELLKGYLDEHDYKIFRKLNGDGRISDTDLAEEVGLSRTAVRRRRKKLLDRGAVDVHAVIVLQELDLAYADILVSLDKQASSEKRSALISRLIDEDLIYSLDSCLGSYDLFVRIWHESIGELKTYAWELFEEELIIDSYEIIPIVHTWKAWDKELDRPDLSIDTDD